MTDTPTLVHFNRLGDATAPAPTACRCYREHRHDPASTGRRYSSVDRESPTSRTSHDHPMPFELFQKEQTGREAVLQRGLSAGHVAGASTRPSSRCSPPATSTPSSSWPSWPTAATMPGRPCSWNWPQRAKRMIELQAERRQVRGHADRARRRRSRPCRGTGQGRCASTIAAQKAHDRHPARCGVAVRWPTAADRPVDIVSQASMEIGIAQRPVSQVVGSPDQDIVQMAALLHAVADEVLLEEPYRVDARRRQLAASTRDGDPK